MNIKSDIPQVVALRNCVERKLGGRLTVHSQFVALVDEIERQLHEHVSETTLERVWGYSTRGYATVSLRTLDVLARLTGYDGWESFCRGLKIESGCESEMFPCDGIVSAELAVGTRLRIGWLPDRMCVVRYLGDNRFVAEETENSSIRPGDTFSCLQFQHGREMYFDCFCRAGVPDGNGGRYVVGQRNGLTTLEILL